MATDIVQDVKMSYRCRFHADELLPLLCKDCDSPVCLNCLTTNHVGHKMGKLSECMEDTFRQLNDAIQGKECARFSLKQIEENLQNNQNRLKRQTEDMVQRVTEREEKIIEEVKNVCQQTIEQITKLAKETETPMRNDEEILKRFEGAKFQKQNDEEFIKCLYFYNELKLLHDKYVARIQNAVPFSLESQDLSVEKIVQLVGSVINDEDSSSDEDSENTEIPVLPILHEQNIIGERIPHHYEKMFIRSTFDAIVLVSPEKKFLLCEENLYHQSNTNSVQELVPTKSFTYVPETDEIIYDLKRSKGLNIFRRTLSANGLKKSFIKLRDEKALCIEHNAETYLVLLSETRPRYKHNIKIELKVRIFDEIGCLTKPTCSYRKDNIKPNLHDRIKICRSSFVLISTHNITFYKGFTFNEWFRYSGRNGYDPSFPFCPADVCADVDGNFLVIDSNDDTVHLLNPKGEFLRIIMSTDDGLRDITCIAIDTFGWLWIGCKNGRVHFANYQHFKSTTRRDRYLEEQKNKESS